MPYKYLLRPGAVCQLNKASKRNSLFRLATIREAGSETGSITIFHEAHTHNINPGDICIFLGMHIIPRPNDAYQVWNVSRGTSTSEIVDIWASILVDEKVLAWQLVSGVATYGGLTKNSPEEKKAIWLKQAATNFKVFFDVIIK
ncbi:MAG: hypothetical protein WC761_02095 [Candidatus Paceibacterota bacterium]|jgi:hypothetical protein